MGEIVSNAAHPYIGRSAISTAAQAKQALARLNRERPGSLPEAVRVTYFFEVVHRGPALAGLEHAARMVLEHGTLKPWQHEGEAGLTKPRNYDAFMSRAEDLQLLTHNPRRGTESGLVTIAYPRHFFDKRRDGVVPLAQLLMAIASEPVTAFSFYRAARVVSVSLPPALLRRFPGQRWPHARVRRYLGLGPHEPLIGTIVKPKTGLTPGLFARSVVQAALAGARFTKADENMHLALRELPRYVRRVVRDLAAAGFDLGQGRPRGRRFLFAPHITVDADRIMDYAQAALDAGANALMFSPYYGGGLLKMAEVIERFDVPVYAHTAGMNLLTGCPTWGFDPRITYLGAALFGAAFMQLTTEGGYLKPDDREKPAILHALREHGLEGEHGMTLAIAGGLGPANLGRNMRLLGERGRMFLAGSSVYGHPDGPTAGVRALILAHRAFREQGIETPARLRQYARTLGAEGAPLARALELASR